MQEQRQEQPSWQQHSSLYITPATPFFGGILKVNLLWLQIFNVGGLQMWLLCGLLARCTQFQEQDYNYLYLTKFSPFYMWLAGEIVALIVVHSWSIVALSYWNLAGVVTQFSTVVAQFWSRQSTTSYDSSRLTTTVLTTALGLQYDPSTTNINRSPATTVLNMFLSPYHDLLRLSAIVRDCSRPFPIDQLQWYYWYHWSSYGLLW